MNVLILERNLDLLESLEEYFSSKEICVWTSQTPEISIPILQKNKIDLIISNYNYGNKNCSDYIRELSELKLIKPLIVFSNAVLPSVKLLNSSHVIAEIPKPDYKLLSCIVENFEQKLL